MDGNNPERSLMKTPYAVSFGFNIYFSFKLSKKSALWPRLIHVSEKKRVELLGAGATGVFHLFALGMQLLLIYNRPKLYWSSK